MIIDLALSASLFVTGVAVAAAPEAKPPVVVILVDALRADRLAALGGSGRATPHMDRFARREAAAFADALSVSSWTKPSVPSLFTGLYPCQHGVARGDTRANAVDGKLRADILPGEAATLAEAFAAAGYRTGAVVENAQISSRFGMAQGFETYSEDGGDAATIRAKALDWLGGIAPADPYFLYVHFLDAHWPLRPRPDDLARFPLETGGAVDLLAPDWRRVHDGLKDGTLVPNDADRRNVEALYDACLLRIDREFGAIVEAVRARPGGDRAIVVLVADHGEALFEGGRLGHGHALTGELLRIPLLVAGPGMKPGEVRNDPVSIVDVAPTVLDLAGVAAPETGFPGHSLRKPVPAERLRLAELRLGATYRLALVEGSLQYGRSVKKASAASARKPAEPAAPKPAAFGAGARVKVSAILAPEGGPLTAHKVRLLEPGDDDFEIEAPVESIDPAARTLRLFGMTVAFGEKDAEKSKGRGLLGLEAYETLKKGDVVKAEGERLASGTLRAKKLERVADSDLSPSGTEAKIEGLVASPAAELTGEGLPRTFTLGGVPLRCEEDARFRVDDKAAAAAPPVVVSEPDEEGPTLEEARIGDGLLPGVTATESLFDRRSDPLGTKDLGAGDAKRLAAMRAKLDALLRVLERRALRGAPRAEIDAKTAEELRRLGYVK